VIELTHEGDVFVLRLDDGENRFGPDAVRHWNDALDRVEKADGPRALVTTGTGKFYSNGLDLDHMLSEGVDGGAYLKDVLALLGRVLTLPFATVAAINGHAFGAGAQVAVAQDYRVMRAERGYFCMPEIDMKAPLHPGMNALLQARLGWPVAHEVIVTGTRFGGPMALERGIVDHVVGEAEVLPKAIEIAQGLAAKADPVMGRLKRDLYATVLDALAADFAA
jgi:enoyl-CoA hydratase/carnithine racemase